MVLEYFLTELCGSPVLKRPSLFTLRILVSLACAAPPALIAAVTSIASPFDSRNECLRYGPDPVGITGKLARHTFYGAPGFGEDPKHDHKETGFYLDLQIPVCTIAGRDESDRALEARA
jgi:hypothetical protein